MAESKKIAYGGDGRFPYGGPGLQFDRIRRSERRKLLNNRAFTVCSRDGTTVANPHCAVNVLGNSVGHKQEEEKMLWTIFVILLVLWLVGLVSSYTMGGFIHLLLVIALVVLVINLISGRRPVV